ncbi:MAG: geranylgeranylglycerol-phosphate geranylgeranyltransferase [Bacteroidia bacterium]
MKVILDFLRLIRINNILMIAITQLFAYYFLNPTIEFYNIFDKEFIFLIISTSLVASAGYIINDYMDVKLDLINKPDKVIVGKTISRRWTMLLHFTCTIIALLLAYSIGKKVMMMVFISSCLLWIYSQFLKKTYLSGNILVSLLTANTLLILFFYDKNVSANGIIVYSIFAFLISLIREIIKDTEDLRGDQQFKCKTLPIVLGVRKTKNVLLWLQTTLIILCFTCVSLFEILSYSSNKIYLMFFMYQLLLVLIPMGIMWWLIKLADTKYDFTRLSFVAKMIMLSGIISMVFWRF